MILFAAGLYFVLSAVVTALSIFVLCDRDPPYLPCEWEPLDFADWKCTRCGKLR